jgi:hypothetical protein
MGDEIEFWTIESSIYPKLDAMFMRGETSLKNIKFELGAGQIFEFSFSSKNGSPINLQQQFSTKEIDCKMYFRSGTQNWFAVDNQANHRQLHMHFESGLQTWNDRVYLPEIITVAQVISDTFVKAEEIVKSKFPNFIIGSGIDFIGCA